jgi:predicted enzyme related to lactoylglutathione lyase
MTHRGLIGAVLYAKDLHRLVDFYAAVAGLQVQTVEDGFAVLGAAPTRLVIVRIPTQIADTIEIETPPMRREDTPIKLVFGVADIAAARQSALDRGGAVNGEEREWNFEGARVCDGHDPEGNVFQLRHTG